jgi:AcrR family transcriptional regulator
MAAAAQFAARGFSGTTFATIADSMSKPRSAVGYHQFTSKEGLAQAVTDVQWNRWAVLIRRSLVIGQPKSISAGVGQLLSILLACALDVHRDSFAAATVRLLADREVVTLKVPEWVTNWETYGDRLLSGHSARGKDQIVRESGSQLDRFLIPVIGAIFAPKFLLSGVSTEERLQSAWRDILISGGFPNAQATLDFVFASVPSLMAAV